MKKTFTSCIKVQIKGKNDYCMFWGVWGLHLLLVWLVLFFLFTRPKKLKLCGNFVMCESIFSPIESVFQPSGKMITTLTTDGVKFSIE